MSKLCVSFPASRLAYVMQKYIETKFYLKLNKIYQLYIETINK